MTEDTATLLIVEDDPLIRTFLADNLTADGYELLVAGTIEDALRELESRRPDLAVVDLRLPDGSGLDLIRRVRTADGIGSRLDPTLPLVVLSGCAASSTACAGSSAASTTTWSNRSRTASCGCGSRPCCGARARGCIAGCCASASWRSTRWRGRRRVRGRRITLAAKEFALLRTLASAPTRVFTKEELLREVWGFRSFGSTRTLDSHACRLRQKLQPRGRPVRRQRLGRGLPAGRRAGE